MTIAWTDLALASLDEISAYIESNFSVSIAQRSLTKIIQTVSMLAKSPQIGMVMHGYEEFGDVRCIYYKRNQIVYRIVNERIQIIIVWDSRRSHEAMSNLVLDFFSR